MAMNIKEVLKTLTSSLKKYTDDAIVNKVDKKEGYSLIADSEIDRLKNVDNYDDTKLKALVDRKIEFIPAEFINETELETILSDYTKSSEMPTKVSQLTNDKNYLTSIPSEYVTEDELTAKGYATKSYVDNAINGIDVNMKLPDVVDSIDQMTDTTKQYILSSDGCVYAYQTTMTEETIEWVDVFNGFQENKRINSSGQVVAGAVDVTNYIPCKPNDTFRLEGFSIPSTYESGKHYQTIGVSATDGGTLKANYLCTDVVTNNTGLSLVEENGYTVGFTLNESFLGSDFSYMVITSQDITANSKVLKKTIVPPKETTAWVNTGLQLSTPRPTVVNSKEEMTDVTKKYVLSTDGYVYAYRESEGDTPLFKNLADPTSSDWLTNYRLSTASTSAQSGAYVTNYIPCKLGDTVRVKGMDIYCYSSNTANKSRFHLYKSDKTIANSDCGYIHYLIDTHGFGSIDGDTTTVIAGHTGNPTTGEVSDTAYIRFCGYLPTGTLDDVIITVNEEIAYGSTREWVSTGKTLDEYIGNADVEEQLDKLDTRVTKLEKDIANIGTGGSTENVTVPSYWLSELDNKADIIQQAVESAGRNKSAFYWYTDAHWYTNAKKSPMLLEYMCKNTPINKVNFGGDIVGDPSPYNHTNNKTVYEWRKMLANVPNHHSVYGNHDLNHWTTDVHNISYALVLASEETNDMVVGGDSYYYIDCPSEKTRYLYLSYLTSNHTAMMEQGQFIVDSLMSAKEGWHIVAIAHRWWQYTSSKTPTVGSVPTYEKEILSVFDSYNARQTRSNSNYFTAQDFTNGKAKVEFCIGGHIHAEYDFTSDGGIPIIITASDTNQERHEGDEDCGAVGTITEQAIYGIIADYKNNKISVVGIGRGESREINL
jgi:hypothetical protein